MILITHITGCTQCHGWIRYRSLGTQESNSKTNVGIVPIKWLYIRKSHWLNVYNFILYAVDILCVLLVVLSAFVGDGDDMGRWRLVCCGSLGCCIGYNPQGCWVLVVLACSVCLLCQQSCVTNRSLSLSTSSSARFLDWRNDVGLVVLLICRLGTSVFGICIKVWCTSCSPYSWIASRRTWRSKSHSLRNSSSSLLSSNKGRPPT